MENKEEKKLHRDTVNVIILDDKGVIESLNSFDDTEEGRQAAETAFIEQCASRISNWDEYDQDDIDGILDQGYEKTGKHTIIIAHSTSPEIVEAIERCPAHSPC